MMRNLLTVLFAAFATMAAAPSDPIVPLFFIANHGQAPSNVRFMAHGSGLTAYFLPGEALFKVGNSSVRVRFPGSSHSAEIEGTQQLAGHANFLTGESDQWQVGVPLFGAVGYRQLYPGIDMLYGGKGLNLKSEFVVGPGADPAQI